jgi:ribonuclease HI
MSLILTADGGSRGNPGPSAYGFAIWESDLDLIQAGSEIFLQTLSSTPANFQNGCFIGITTNNQAEWQGLMAGLEYILNNFDSLYPDQKSLIVALDSDLVVKQITGIYKVKNPGLQPLFEKTKMLLAELKSCGFDYKFGHIYRQYNKVADSEVNKALDKL